MKGNRLIRAAALALTAVFLVAASEPTRDVWQIGPFERPVDSPVVTPSPDASFNDPILRNPVRWEALHSFNPAAIARGGKVYLLYRAEDDSGSLSIGGHTSRIGLAVSDDGLHFVKRAQPVLFANNDSQKAREWPGGVEDPRIVEAPDGRYVMTYTQWNRSTFSLAVATSRDLIHWTKHGPAFQGAADGRYDTLTYKSGAILTRLQDGRLIAARIHGQYWMYWGEGRVHIAHSTDLVHWTPVEESTGALKVLLGPRVGKFDSDFPEAGPPPLLTKKGIVVLYNAKNAATDGDRSVKGHGYSVGEALFSASDPSRLVARTDRPVLQPERPWERTGQYADGTTFGEGLVMYHGQWFLYYGCADSVVGVARAPVTVPAG